MIRAISWELALGFRIKFSQLDANIPEINPLRKCGSKSWVAVVLYRDRNCDREDLVHRVLKSAFVVSNLGMISLLINKHLVACAIRVALQEVVWGEAGLG